MLLSVAGGGCVSCNTAPANCMGTVGHREEVRQESCRPGWVVRSSELFEPGLSRPAVGRRRCLDGPGRLSPAQWPLGRLARHLTAYLTSLLVVASLRVWFRTTARHGWHPRAVGMPGGLGRPARRPSRVNAQRGEFQGLIRWPATGPRSVSVSG